jgi:Fe-S-cluster containining protein
MPLALTAHPAAGPPCHECTALCCRYFALEIDAPEDRDDFEILKWYLIHGNAWIWVEDGDWHLQVDAQCRYLGPGNACTIYEKRPQICRDYGLPEKREHPDDPLCDYFSQGISHDHEFRTMDEIDAFAATFLAKKAEERARRSAAAKRAWNERRRATR